MSSSKKQMVEIRKKIRVLIQNSCIKIFPSLGMIEN